MDILQVNNAGIAGVNFDAEKASGISGTEVSHQDRICFSVTKD